jgi:hypothetical protein
MDEANRMALFSLDHRVHCALDCAVYTPTHVRIQWRTGRPGFIRALGQGLLLWPCSYRVAGRVLAFRMCGVPNAEPAFLLIRFVNK